MQMTAIKKIELGDWAMERAASIRRGIFAERLSDEADKYEAIAAILLDGVTTLAVAPHHGEPT